MSPQSINRNFIGQDGFIHNIYAGDQTVGTLRKAHLELKELIARLKKKKKRVLVLTDITKLGTLNLHARKYAIQIIQDLTFDKVAVFGNPFLTEKLINFIILASGQGYKMKYFSNEEDAIEWLLMN